MPRRPVDDNKRMSLRIGPETKTTLLRAAALTQTDLTEFVIKHALDAAREIIDKTERIELSERDSLRLLKLLEEPPQPTAKLQSAAHDLPEGQFP